MAELNEPILGDGYTVYGGYLYVADGKVVENPWCVPNGMTAGEYKRRDGIQELRRCDMFGRARQRKEELAAGAEMTETERMFAEAAKRTTDAEGREERRRKAKKPKRSYRLKKFRNL